MTTSHKRLITEPIRHKPCGSLIAIHVDRVGIGLAGLPLAGRGSLLLCPFRYNAQAPRRARTVMVNLINESTRHSVFRALVALRRLGLTTDYVRGNGPVTRSLAQKRVVIVNGGGWQAHTAATEAAGYVGQCAN